MNSIVFAHSNFPGQFAPVAVELLRRGFPVAAVTNTIGRQLPGVVLAQWRPARGPTPGIHPLARRPERDFIAGRAAALAATALKDRGWNPACVASHPRLGTSVFLREVFPSAKHVVHAELYYQPHGGDADFDPEFGQTEFEDALRSRALNALLALAYVEADELVCPTEYQRSLLPPLLRSRARTIHEGIDTDLAKPDQHARFVLKDGRVLDRSTPVITYVTRRFEPLRGAHVFFRALPKLLRAVPQAHVLVIGSDDPNVYGVRAEPGKTWRQVFLDQLEGQLDLDRVHFPGIVPYQQMLSAMAISAAHVYLTYPFVLSWSMLEAMACECLVVGSNTPPVAEVIEDGRNGLLVDFFDVDALSDRLIEACLHSQRFDELRRAARKTVQERFDLRRICLPAWLDLLGFG